MTDILIDDVAKPAPEPTPTLTESLLSLLKQHHEGLSTPARERAAKAFVRSLEWMEANPTLWEIRHIKPSHYIEQLDKPRTVIVRGRPVDMYKAQTINHSEVV
ncbi:hypothetical protein [Pseudomonas sp. 8 R 14]|uniref:hypothetical protein n=1 Tax=Pseudomonas sp. 8 R 14 TaxID=1844092 RepID=UPI00114CCF48|nr:hypothetical protein [Pseudomonas sp. 8 R 14]